MFSIVNHLRDLVNESIIYKDDKGTVITLREKKASKCKDFAIDKTNCNTLTLEIDIEDFDIHQLFKKGIKDLKKNLII